MSKFRKKPVVIEAWQNWTGDREIDARTGLAEMAPPWLEEAMSAGVAVGGGGQAILISTLEGVMRCDVGDWIIRGVNGELYPCKPDIFDATYTRESRQEERRERLERHLAAAINSCSAENGSNTPDFILAEFAASCIDAFDRASRCREKWYGVELRPGKDRPCLGSPCESCGGATVCLGDDWACVKCGLHGGVASV